MVKINGHLHKHTEIRYTPLVKWQYSSDEYNFLSKQKEKTTTNQFSIGQEIFIFVELEILRSFQIQHCYYYLLL